MRGILLGSLLALALTVAGCSGSGGGSEATESGGLTPEQIDDAAGGVDVEATATTGVIRGVVVDTGIRPIAGATVTLLVGGDSKTAQTNELGAFGFDGLAPGTYFVSATKIGFNTVQQSVDVAAGVSDPSPIRIKLQQDPALVPYYVPYDTEGYLECSTRDPINGGFSGICDNIPGNLLPKDNNIFPLEKTGNISFVQGELVWKNTQNLGSSLSLVLGPNSCQDIKYEHTDGTRTRSDGPTPRIVNMNTEEIEANEANERGICYRVFAWFAEESGGNVGFVFEQSFHIYTHMFYNFSPPAGWTFGADGHPKIPT